MRGARNNKDTYTKESKSSKGEPQKIRNELTEEQKREIKEAFSTFEETGIESDELKSAMQALGFDAKNPDVQKILDKLDKHKKPLTFEEYMDVMIDKEENKDPETEMKKAFKVLCEEGSDKITLKSLSKICADLGEKISDEELQEMINEANKEQDDEVSGLNFGKPFNELLTQEGFTNDEIYQIKIWLKGFANEEFPICVIEEEVGDEEYEYNEEWAIDQNRHAISIEYSDDINKANDYEIYIRNQDIEAHREITISMFENEELGEQVYNLQNGFEELKSDVADDFESIQSYLEDVDTDSVSSMQDVINKLKEFVKYKDKEYSNKDIYN